MRSAVVNPYLPRVAQGVTGVLSLVAVVLQNRWVALVALALVLLALVAPRWSPVNIAFRAAAPKATSLEPVAPVRFAQLLAATFLVVGLVSVASGADLVGWIVIAAVAAMALFSAVSGICVGCAVYRLALRRRSADGDVRDMIGLSGPGPWMVVLTAPGCTRCEPVALQVEGAAREGTVVRVDLTRTPSAARLPVASVPALVSVGPDGQVAGTAAGRLGPEEITRFVEHAGLTHESRVAAV